MPSPTSGGYYRRKGGAYSKNRSTGKMKYVGSGKGRYAKRDYEQDKARSARVNKSKARRYGQSYDSSHSVGAGRGSPRRGL
jgi:hypothetical protein